jgi:hypothetical protein
MKSLIFEKVRLRFGCAEWRSVVNGAGGCSPSPSRSLIGEPYRGTTE